MEPNFRPAAVLRADSPVESMQGEAPVSWRTWCGRKVRDILKGSAIFNAVASIPVIVVSVTRPNLLPPIYLCVYGVLECITNVGTSIYLILTKAPQDLEATENRLGVDVATAGQQLQVTQGQLTEAQKTIRKLEDEIKKMKDLAEKQNQRDHTFADEVRSTADELKRDLPLYEKHLALIQEIEQRLDAFCKKVLAQKQQDPRLNAQIVGAAADLEKNELEITALQQEYEELRDLLAASSARERIAPAAGRTDTAALSLLNLMRTNLDELDQVYTDDMTPTYSRSADAPLPPPPKKQQHRHHHRHHHSSKIVDKKRKPAPLPAELSHSGGYSLSS